jgi:hypothetical protein
MPENLVSISNVRLGELQAYGKMLDAFYPYVSSQGKIDLRMAAPKVDPVYESLLAIGYAQPVLQFLAKKAVLDIPDIKTSIALLRPEGFAENFDA